jgi:hypothetical protein
MKKKTSYFVAGLVAILIVAAWFVHHKRSIEEAYSGMSIIPGQRKDVPLFEGLKPSNPDFVMKGNHWKEIYEFYLQELPKHGWKAEHKITRTNETGDSHSFDTSWRKKGLDWELTVMGGYIKMTNQTEVIFDKLPILTSTTWINHAPQSICIYHNLTDNNCVVIKDKKKIDGIVRFINSGIDWDKKVEPHAKTGMIVVGDFKIKVFYEADEEVYLQTEKGTKLMKPEPEFFQLTGLPIEKQE